MSVLFCVSQGIAILTLNRPASRNALNLEMCDRFISVSQAIHSNKEIQVRGWNSMRGYCNDEEATAKAFTADGWLHTGDLGELTADGRLRMDGRLKDVFRVGGENVAPAEVEEVLLAHPAVETAQVIGVPDARLGEVACAYVTLKSGSSAFEGEILSFAKTRTANFRVPRYLRISKPSA